ncbi:hypothetical protein OIU84_000358 [Salix udensis]|uniref:DUF4283 domain-containing protein n=1 Tax=Salix udensis TaxID=889485 RepID=A0AAD6PNU1_9ROSI|nr:hypothetical protein OIU84_000358 [Salix udensis]
MQTTKEPPVTEPLVITKGVPAYPARKGLSGSLLATTGSAQQHATAPTWADKVRVTDSTTRHALEPIPQKPAGSCLKIPADMPMHSDAQWEEEVVTAIIEKGPWMFGGKNIILQKWTPLFQFDRQKIQTISVWVRLRGLPLPLWTKQGLSMAASMIGKPLSCDEQTIHCRRMDYARICVELNASLPFVHHFDVVSSLSIEPQRVTMDYEWKPPRCEICTSFGLNCVKKKEQEDRGKKHEDGKGWCNATKKTSHDKGQQPIEAHTCTKEIETLTCVPNRVVTQLSPDESATQLKQDESTTQQSQNESSSNSSHTESRAREPQEKLTKAAKGKHIQIEGEEVNSVPKAATEGHASTS